VAVFVGDHPLTDTAWKNRIVGYREVRPEDLLANPRNWRVHPKHQQAALKGALDELGWIQNVIVNTRTGFVVDGHARVALAIRHNQPTVPTTEVDLSPDEEALALVTLDPIRPRWAPARRNCRRSSMTSPVTTALSAAAAAAA
jgi:hypothetical protein